VIKEKYIQPGDLPALQNFGKTFYQIRGNHDIKTVDSERNARFYST